MLGFRSLMRLLRWVVLFSVGLALSAIVHLNTGVGRRAGRVLVSVLVSDLIAGKLEVGRVKRLFPDRIVLHDVSLYDPRGTRVIHGDEIVLVLDVMAALDGTLRFSHARLQGGTLRLEEKSEGLTFLEALGAAEPSTEPSTGDPFHAVVDDMRLRDVTVYGSMLGASNLHASNVDVDMRMEFEEYMDLRVFRGTGLLDGPQDFVANLDAVTARVNTAPHVGSTVDLRTHYGDQNARVHLRYAVPSNLPETAEPRLDLRMEFDPLDMTTVSRIGFDWASPLVGRAQGTVRLFGLPSALELDAAIEHEGGPIVLRGQLPTDGDLVVHASTTALDVDLLIPDTPSITLAGDVVLTMPDASSGRRSTVHADVHGFVFEDYAIPSLTLDGTILDDRIVLDSIEAPYGRGGRLEAEGYATFEGDAHVVVSGSLGDIANDPNVQRHAPGSRGRVSIRANIDRQNGELRAHVHGTGQGVSMSDVSAPSLGFEVTSVTNAAGTRLRVGAEATDLRVSSIMLGSGRASLRSVGSGYEFEGSFDDPRVNGRTRASGVLTTHGDSQTLTRPHLRYERSRVVLDLRADRLEFNPGQTLLAENANLAIDGVSAARMNARWTTRGADNAQLVIDRIPLDALTRLFSPLVPELRGIVRGTATLSGDLESDPTIRMTGSIEDGGIRTLRDLVGGFDFTLERGVLGGHLALDGGVAGSADITLNGRAQLTSVRLAEALREGEYNVHGEMDSVDLAPIVSGVLGTSDAGVGGCLNGSLELDGYLAFAPELNLNMSVGALTIGSIPALDVAMISQYDGQNLEATATIGASPTSSTERRVGRCRTSAMSDAGASGALAEVYGSVQAPLIELIAGENSFMEELQVVPWGLSMRVTPRRLGTLPENLRNLVPALLHDFDAGMSFHALGGFGMVQSSVSATLDYAGDTNRFVCGRGSRPRATLTATHANGDTRARLETFVGPGRVMTALARTSLPLEEWLATGAFGEIPSTALDIAFTTDSYDGRGARIKGEIESSGIPFLCEYFKGPLRGTMIADDLFTDHPTTSGALLSEGLQFRRIERSIRGTVRNAIDDTPIIPQIALKFSGDRERLSFNHDMTWWGEENISQITGYVDWLWDRENIVPLIASDAPFDLRLDAPSASGDENAEPVPSQIPLQMVAGWIPLFGRVEGSMEAELHAFGTLDDPSVEGRVHISEATIVIDPIGQRLRNVSGVVDFDENGAQIRHLVAHDEAGTATFDGNLVLDGFTPTDFHLEAVANSFPVRDEGSVIARLTGRVGLDGTMTDERASATMNVQTLDIALETASSQSPIGLAEHPDVRLVGLSVERAAEEESSYPLSLRIPRTPRFWVRSDAFSAMVSTALEIDYASPDMRIAGDLELHRGYFEVFGKRFDVEQGSMVFDGGASLNPSVSLVAVHQLRGGGRQDIVIVRASGTLTDPRIEFASPLVASGDQGQIICVLITGRSSSSGQCGETSQASSTTNQAGTQAAQFLTSIAFGLATVALREQFGDYIPMIAIESGASLSTPRVRAGFNVDRLIPERLRRVVRGIYIEGYVSGSTGPNQAQATRTSSATANSQFGFSVELQFPHNIVTQGEYAPSNSAWRLGVTWEP